MESRRTMGCHCTTPSVIRDLPKYLNVPHLLIYIITTPMLLHPRQFTPMHIVSARYLRIRQCQRQRAESITQFLALYGTGLLYRRSAHRSHCRSFDDHSRPGRRRRVGVQNACTQAYRRSRRTAWVASGLCIDCALRLQIESMKMGFMSQRGTEMRE